MALISIRWFLNLRHILLAACALTALFAETVLAQENEEEKDEKLTIELKVGVLSQSASDAFSGSFKFNFEKKFGAELLEFGKNKNGVLKWTPEFTYSITKLELEEEEEDTTELTFTFFSLLLKHEKFEPYIRLKYGDQEIDTTSSTGEETSEDNKVFIWNPGISVPIDGKVKLSWDYQLSQKKAFEDKTQYKSTISLTYSF